MTPERQTMDVDIVCVGFGPATAGFLTTLEKTPEIESLQVLCYERADDVGFGVSGLVTRARGIRASIPDLNPAEIPMATPVTEERLVYLLDPVGASRRSRPLRSIDAPGGTTRMCRRSLFRRFARDLANAPGPFRS